MKSKILRLKDSLNNDLKGDTERKIQKYLKNNIHPALREIQEETLSEKLKHDIHHYFGKISPKSELFYIQRNKLDESITLINRKIADILDEKQTLAQHIFPHFYERFKSDGVEHNLFVGQSISPNQKYSGEIIKELRFWQLETMCLVEHQLEKFKQICQFI
jgi:predicted  nucleic acid-binding Zn-ribbon protein